MPVDQRKPLADVLPRKRAWTAHKFVTGQEGPLMARLMAEVRQAPTPLADIPADRGRRQSAGSAGMKLAWARRCSPAVLDRERAGRTCATPRAGIFVGARARFFNTHKVKPAQLSSYEDRG